MAIFGVSLAGRPPYFGLIIGLVLGLGLIGVFYWQLVIPKNDSLDKLDVELAGLQAKIQEGRAAKQKLPQFREEVRRLELDLEKLLRILPARRNTPELLRRVRTLAEEGDFDLRLFDPGDIQQREFYSEWPITVSLNGDYHGLAQFFARISKFPRILNVDNLQIRSLDSPSPTRTIQASFVAKTFVYTEAEVLDEDEQAQGGPR